MNDNCKCAVMEVNHIWDNISKSIARRSGEVTFLHYLAFLELPHQEVQLCSHSLQVCAPEQDCGEPGREPLRSRI